MKKLRILLSGRGSNFLAIAGMLLSTFALVAQTTGENQCSVAQATPCRVSGKLTARHVYGPPWFGEKKGDKPRFTIYVIELHAPVHIACIRDHDSDRVKDCGTTTRLQIYPRDANVPESRLRSLVGNEVVAMGTTAEPVAPMDQTPGTMDIVSLEPATKHGP